MFGGAGGTGFGGFGQQNQQPNQPNQQPNQGTSLFGAPQQPATGTGFGGFGAQPFGGAAPGGSLFGQPAQQQQQQQPQRPVSGFTFGQSTNTTSTPFGQQAQSKPSGFGGFGANTSTTPASGNSFGGFGASQQPAASPFGGGASSSFGAKPAGGLFGQPAATPFGQPQQTGGLFGAGNGLGVVQVAPMPTQGTLNPPYDLKPQPEGSPDTPYDHDKKTPQLLNYTSITCMKPYRGASLEELRLQDYEQGRKSGNGGSNPVGGFGQSTSSGFGAPAQTGGLFGQQQQTPAPAFGGGGLFGQSNQQQQQQPGQASGGLFGSTNNAGTSLFGQQQQQPQTGGGLFGQPANTQQQPASTGFGFGAQQNTSSGFSFGQNNSTQQQNKPAGGLFGGGFGTSTSQQPAAPASSGFSFGGASNQAQTGNSTGFGTSSTGGFGFGSTAANANGPKPGGLFGAPATTTAPTFGGFGAPAQPAGQIDNKPAFSFGGGFGNNATGQQTTAAPSGGLFGSIQPGTTSQPTTTPGFNFGGASNSTVASGTTGGLFGGQQSQQQQSSTGFGAPGGGLFGTKPATGGLFGQPQQQQQQQSNTGGLGFGAPNAGNTGGGLFGNKPAAPTGGLFGTLGGSTQTQTTGAGGLFGNNQQTNTSTLGGGIGGGLFGNNQGSQLGGGGLFGSTNQQPASNNAGGGLFGSSTLGGSTAGGFNFGGQNNSQPQLGNSLFSSSQLGRQAPNLQMSLNSNPYGTDALFGGQAGTASSSIGLGSSTNNGLHSQPHLPFNVSLSRSTAKKQPPLVPPFRPSPRSSIHITKLRGSTPGLRESTPGREGTPTGSNSLFSSSPAPTSSYQRLSSSSPSIFRGLSDDLPRSQRESSTPVAPLPPQAFVSRPSVKRLVLDDGSRNSTTGLGRGGSLFSARASTVTREINSTPAFDRDATPGQSQINFSPALETAASSRAPRTNEGDSSFNSNVFNNRRAVEETPSKAVGGSEAGDTSLPALNRSTGKQSKEDALLPLDYWTVPALSELRDWSHAELRAVEGFLVGRKNVGTVTFDAPVDLTTVGELSNIPGGIVILRLKECIVYPEEDECFEVDTGRERDGVQPGFEMRKVPGGKAKEGEGLNQPAIVRLLRCWPIDRTTREPIKDEEHIRFKQLVNKLKRRNDADFVNFEAESGAWTFRVHHFSRYGLDENDEDGTDEDSPEKKGNPKAKDKKDSHEDKSGKRDKSNDDDEDDPPPMKALDDSTDEDGSEAGRDIRASNVAGNTPSRMKSQRTPRASGLAAIREATPGTNRGSDAPSTMSSQPWAASLGLEARRVQVMQASFFGGAGQTEAAAVPIKKTAKQSRMASPSFLSSGTGSISSRTSFLAPSTIVPEASPAVDVVLAARTDIDNFAPALSGGVTARPRKFTRLDMSSSVVDGGHGIAIDAGLSMGRSFRVGWGPDGSFAHSGKWLSSSKSTATSTSSSSEEAAATDSFSTIKMAKIQVFSKEDETREIKQIIELLEVQLKHSIVEDDDDDVSECPAIFPMPSLRFHHFVSALEGLQDSHYEVANFKLGAALFDEVDTKLDMSTDPPHDFVDEVIKIRRRNNVANWIRWYEGDTVRSEIRSQLASTGKNAGEQAIFSYLSAGFFEEACEQAIDVGDVRLATLLAQTSSGGDEEEFRLDLLEQLSIWRSSGADVLISTEYRRIIELLSGNLTWSKGNGKREEGEAVKDIQIASGLDWIRTFALFMHFDSRFDTSLIEILERYESNIGGEADIVPPLPPYLEKEVRPGSQRFRAAVKSGVYPRDVLFHLLKLFCNPLYELENILQPLNSSANRLSYSLAFHTGLVISKVLSKRDFSDRIGLGIDNHDLAQEANLQGNSGNSDRLCIDFAMQLEILGLWKWAAFVLLHLELRQSRIENVQALLSRNVDKLILSLNSSKELSQDVKFLVQTLRIPIYWLYEAKADRACSSEDRWQEYQYSLLAQDMSRAHMITIQYLAPEGIIRQDFEFILHLFAPFQQGSTKVNQTNGATQDVAGWTRGGQIYVDYIAICRSLPWLLNNYSKSSTSQSSTNVDTAALKGGNLLERDQDSLLAKVELLSSKIPRLINDVREMFDGFQQTTSMFVAQTQMITSLYTCIRMLKSSSLSKVLNVDFEEEHQVQSGRPVAVEVENLQFFANDYSSLLVGTAA